MLSYPILSKMEEGRRKPRGSTLNKTQISPYRVLSSRVALFLVILVLCDRAAGEDVPDTNNMTRAAVQPKSSTCWEGIPSNGNTITYCKGYTIIPTDAPNSKTRILDLSEGNALQVLNDGDLERANLHSLYKLDLRNCRIRTIIRGSFRGGENLHTLDLANNKIDVLDPEVFADLKMLHYLDLQGNLINRFDTGGIFPSLTRLASLDLSSCKLYTIPDGAFDNLTSLRKLSLQNNSLETLSWKVFRNTKLNEVDLSGNKWRCDCHLKFLKDILTERGLVNSFGKWNCSSSPEGADKDLTGAKWNEVPDNDLICPAKIYALTFKSYEVSSATQRLEKEHDKDHHEDNEPNKVELGQDVYFECKYSGFPEAKIHWLKGDALISEVYRKRVNDASRRTVSTLENQESGNQTIGGQSPVELKDKVEILNDTRLEQGMDDMEKKMNYRFIQYLIVRRVEGGDKGVYHCVVETANKPVEASVFLNVSVIEDGLVIGGIGGKKGVAIWIWILIALLCLLILVLFTLLMCLAWRRKEKKKQEGFRKVLQDKFKDSNVDIGELLDVKTSTSSPQQTKDSKHPEGSTPLLDGRSETSTVIISDHFPPHKISHLPDIAIANGTLVRNSAIFSPKPSPAQNGHLTPADARKEFFARQISEPPYMRPGSAMSLARPTHFNAAQKRFIYANNQMNYSEPQYAVPEQIMTLPRSSSAMSMSAIPDHNLRRQMFLRQNYQPNYATASRVPPYMRKTSTSSEPGHELNAYNYLSLPRRQPRYQNWSRAESPTNSTCSNYSTLSWRPNVNPATGVVSDGIGPRTGANGGSTLSLNKTPDSLAGSPTELKEWDGRNGLDSMRSALTTPTMNGGGKIKTLPRNQRLGHMRTPSSLTRGHNDFFSFEPIQEADGSESASTFTLEQSGRQTPQHYTTQSLARGEPRYKKKKPPPIAVLPANLKEPSRAFDHLKQGRSVSPALRNTATVHSQPSSNSNGVKADVRSDTPEDEPVILEDLSIRKSRLLKLQNGVQNPKNAAPVLESPIDEVSAVHGILQIPQSDKLPSIVPTPPPKPKRSQEALDKGSTDNLNEGKTNEKSGFSEMTDCGTVV